jgi:glutamate dehydrogenase
MEGTTRNGAAERIEGALDLVRRRVAPERRAATERFVREYFRQVAPEDVESRDSADLYGAALSHWNFGRQRDPGRPRVRAFNPSLDDHGWQSTHTIVEVVTDDMPFLVDSVTMEVNRHGLTLHLFVHPIVRALRDADGVLEDVVAGADGGVAAIGRRESFMHVEVDRVADPAALARLAADVERVLGDVRAAVDDWPKMLARLRGIAADLEKAPPPLAPGDLAEGRAFIEWLADNHFTLLGYRCHDLVEADGAPGLAIVPGSGLGILRERGDATMSQSFQALPPETRARARVPELLIVTKGNSRSTVHRPGYLDYVGVKRFDPAGKVIGEHRFVGLYTSTAYSSTPGTIPLLRTKVANVVARAGVSPGSHAGKALLNILETYPRDELFQIGEEDLLATATGILHLGDRQRFRLFVRRDAFQRFVSCLLYVPREHYNTELRRRWQALLLDAFQGTAADFNVHLSESVLARILITVRTVPGRIPDVNLAELETRLAAAARRWEDDLATALVADEGEAEGNRLFRAFGNGFPAGYREDLAPRVAVADVRMLARVAADGALGLNLHRPLEAAPGTLRLRLYHRGGPVPLSDSLPMLERMGLRVLDERPYRVQPAEGAPVWIHDFGLATGSDRDVDLDAVQGAFEDALARVFAGTVENDDFNRLVLAAGLSAEEVVVLRAYARYLRQTGFPLSQSFIEQTLAAHGPIAAALVRLFRLRFDPAAGAEVDEAEARQFAAIEASLDAVENLSEDRVLRQLLALVLATTRTNFWCTDAAGARRPFLSFKFDPAKIPGLPEPRPMFEIFVCSTRFEGVHLRGGRVARGGLRWSDRPEDFRTEVLGLVKAQMVKNAVIVPVGSKGGFVLKKAPPAADREAYLAEGVACYQDYLRGLLDLTDNLVAGKVVAPPRVRRHDGDDPYLVVAADKGTASFSDHANAISKEYGFWLGDAFASGGSAGYDHKAMGITARGAWESAKRHFRELGVDIQANDFTVVGIGDMSGDVFGNGMLLSKHIRLVAAFDHRHVFIDPAPDPAASWVERERLFRLPRSSWADYDASVISRGGGVWPRTAKSIPLSPEAQAALGVQAEALTPAELVSAILKAPVDLLYNGGIGTYVKSARESHASVGDRANDAVRVDGRELRCKAVVEGGNLGCTQLGRVEYALAGGRINTDAIDNSAGVDTSDHEVNLKILLGQAIADGELTERQRNKLLADMTVEVAKLVLRDNYFQTQSLSLSGRLGHALLEQQARFIRFLEKAGRLNRALEFLPDDEEIAAREAAGAGLASPERAVLLAYAKIWLYDELLASALPDDPWVATALGRYFPEPARTQFAPHAARHPLRREIIATHVANSMVNRVGSTFVHRLMETTGAAPAEVVRAYLLTREVFDFVGLWQAIEALDNKVPDALQAEMLIETGRTIVRGTAWFLRSRRLGEDMAATIARFRPGVEQVGAVFGSLLEPAARAPIEAQAGGYAAAGVPEAVAVRVAAYDTLFGALDITEIAEGAGRPVSAVAGVYFALAARLGLGWLRGRIATLPADTHWRMLAKGALRDELAELQRAIAGHALASAGAAEATAAIIDAWAARNRSALQRTERMLAELRALPSLDLAMLSVALRELRALG